MNSTSTLLTIVRHGQTSANVDGVWHGSTNTPLTPHGHQQAAATAAFISAGISESRPIERIYASPLDRAHHTAEAIGKSLGLVPEIEPDLVEYDLGSWEGLSFESLYKEKKLFTNMQSDPHYAPHGGESPLQVGERLAGAMRRIAARHPQDRVIIVTHGGALSIAFGLLLDNDYSNWTRMVKNCSVSELVLEPQPELIAFNQTDHLPEESEA
ncbi:MAG: histidine phosphatase family protein [Myxococcota bacterium]